MPFAPDKKKPIDAIALSLCLMPTSKNILHSLGILY